MNDRDSLHEAILQADLKKVKALLKRNRSLVFIEHGLGGTPLHWAAKLDHKGIAKFLLAKKADVQAKHHDHGDTPLHWAASWGSKEVAGFLRANRADANSKNNHGETPLHKAAIMNRVDIAKLLLAGAEVNAKNNRGETPLHKAAGYDSRQAAELLLVNRADVNAKDHRGRTPLHRAAEAGWGHKGTAELLLAHGSEVNGSDNNGLTPLHLAAYSGSNEVTEVLLAKLIEKLPEDNVRVGVISEEVYCAIMRHLPEHQRMLWCFAYRLGIRKGELLKIRVEWLLPYWKLEEPFIKIPGFDDQGNRITKSGKPHTIPLYHPELRCFVRMALDRRDPNCPWLFQHNGKRMKNVRTGFEQACSAAGHREVIFHDTRRTAIARMEDAGISRREAVQITGHLTETVYKRYDIGTEAGATEAGRKLREFDARQSEFANRFANEAMRNSPCTRDGDSAKYLN